MITLALHQGYVLDPNVLVFLGIIMQKKLLLLIIVFTIIFITKQGFFARNSIVRYPLSQKLVSLQFENISLRMVLHQLAEFRKINMVVSDKVSGNITLRLKNVPWNEALDMILKTHALGKRFQNNVMLIAPLSELLEEEEKSLSLEQKTADLLPLQRAFLPIRFAKALDIANIIKDKERGLLSDRGSLSIDGRTNTLMVQDTRKALANIQKLVIQIDVPVPQILIEARIVDVNKDFVRDLGISFGVLKGEGSPETSLPPEAEGSVPLSERLHVDLGAAALHAHTAASLGLAFASLGNDILLDLELSAMESEGRGEIIASPRLITMNQEPAMIQSGEEVPYQEATSSGATSVAFKKAVLSLQVIPQVTPNGKILMNLQINQDRISSQKYNGVPAIMTKEIKTCVFVDNGETIVLGGIYKQERGSSMERVAFLGKLPGVGGLFRKKHQINSNEELLIFITPRIITDGQSFAKMERYGNFMADKA